MVLNNKEAERVLKKKPTYREEANALINQCIRAGFIEELHAGKHSELLEDRTLSRITQEEMKKIMIETSAQLAEYLKIKEQNPEKYHKFINAITLMYTYNWDKRKKKYPIKGYDK